jgi:hypothetical protein
MAVTIRPMTRTIFRRLMASAETREAEYGQALQDARAYGRAAGLLMVAKMTGRHPVDLAILTAERGAQA